MDVNICSHTGAKSDVFPAAEELTWRTLNMARELLGGIGRVGDRSPVSPTIGRFMKVHVLGAIYHVCG